MGFTAGTNVLKANEMKLKKKKKQIGPQISRGGKILKEVGAKFVHSFILEKQAGTIQLSPSGSSGCCQFY